jgi:hypothetical protein
MIYNCCSIYLSVILRRICTPTLCTDRMLVTCLFFVAQEDLNAKKKPKEDKKRDLEARIVRDAVAGQLAPQTAAATAASSAAAAAAAVAAPPVKREAESGHSPVARAMGSKEAEDAAAVGYRIIDLSKDEVCVFPPFALLCEQEIDGMDILFLCSSLASFCAYSSAHVLAKLLD